MALREATIFGWHFRAIKWEANSSHRVYMLNVLVSVPSLIVYFQLRWLFKCSWNGWFYNPSSKRTTMMEETSLCGEKHSIASRAAGFESNFPGSRDVVAECGYYSHRHQRCQEVNMFHIRFHRCSIEVSTSSTLNWCFWVVATERHSTVARWRGPHYAGFVGYSLDLHDYFHMNAICVFSTLCKLMFRGCRRFTIFSRISLVNGSSWFVCSTISRDCSSQSSCFPLCTMVLQSALERRGVACCWFWSTNWICGWRSVNIKVRCVTIRTPFLRI
jgi:hypothetical protein